jgi:hypothetical protein
MRQEYAVFFVSFYRRKCEIRGDTDGKEPKDLTSSRAMFPSTQIKMREEQLLQWKLMFVGIFVFIFMPSLQ